MPDPSASSQAMNRPLNRETNEFGLVAKTETVDSSPKQSARSKVIPVGSVKAPGWLQCLSRAGQSFLPVPSWKDSSIVYGSPTGTNVAENVASPAIGVPVDPTTRNEPLNVVPFQLTDAGCS